MIENPPAVNDLPEDESTGEELVPLSAAAEWQEIVDTLIDDLYDYDYPDEVLKATEYLISGWPSHQVAERLGVKRETVRGWLTRYPKMAVAVNYGQRELHRWRMSRLERQFLSAVEASQDILDLGTKHRTVENLDAVDPKILAIKAQQARYIIGLFAGQKLDLQVKGPSDEAPKLKAQKEALDYLADRISDNLGDTVTAAPETTYRVLDGQFNSGGPLTDDRGDPYHGILGELDKNEAGTLCHICGERHPKLYMHVTKGHKMKDRYYEIVFMLDRGTLKEYGR
ncbi:hypothetical protein KAR91_66445 [Candidatus Pacearchaeota archaeon]|nr:hypothetical protein [Candidatus Pacearchaeota archaeon]